MTETGGSDGEAIPAPDVGGAGGSRAQQGGNAGSAIIASRFCYEDRSAGSRLGLNCKREQQLDSLCLIGQGSAALVYLVRCRSTGRLSALKVQRKTDHARSVERVQMEREVMVDARHPLVTPLYAAFQDRLYLYLDMEYCPGGSLDNFVRYCVKRNLTEDEARFYAAEITLGLEFLHSKGYVYRDLKAANVLVAASGHIKLTDFGIAGRGEVEVETEYKVVSPPHPLPRTQSSPIFSEAPLVAGMMVTGHQRRQTHPEEASRSQKQGFSCAPTTRVRDTKKTSGGYPTLFHRRQQNTSSEVTTPHLAGLGARICDKFTRARGSVSTRSASGSKLSSLEGSAAAPSPGIQRNTPDTRGGIGAPVPFFRGCPREGERKQDLPPSAPGMVPLDRSGNPYSNGLLRVARQTSVALAESSWGVLSGSPEYMAPEVLMHDSQGSAVDWWGMGILTYELLFGRTPFAGEGGKTRLTYLNIMNKEVQFPEGSRREEGEVSGVCKDFIRALLTKDPRRRAGSRGAHAVKAHPFFKGVSWDYLLKQEAPLVPRLLGTRCCVRPHPVENTSGWWWDVEDGIVDVEEEHRSRQGKVKQEDVWSLFDEFNWINDAAVRGRSMKFEERGGACGKQGNIPLGSDGVSAATAASRT